MVCVLPNGNRSSCYKAVMRGGGGGGGGGDRGQVPGQITPMI